MTSRAKSPAYLEALEQVRQCKAAVAGAKDRYDYAIYANQRWIEDIAALSKSGLPILTAQQIARRGEGSGVECLYFHRHEDPYQEPFSAEEVARFGEHVATAQERLAEAEQAVHSMVETGEYDFDIWDGNHRYVWWPLNSTAADYQGRPLSQADLDRLDHHALQSHIRQGTVRERVTVQV